MATLTPSRTAGQPVSEPSDFAERVRRLLNHPMASMYLVIVPSALLLGIGTMMVWSASTVFAFKQFGHSYYFLRRHLLFLGVGAVVALFLSRFPTERLRRMGWFVLGLAVLLILLTFVPGVGYDVKGNRNWINFGSGSAMIRLQPSEFAKLALIVWGATIFVVKRRLLVETRHLLVPFVPGSLIIMALVVLQRDLGTAMILGTIVFTVLWFVGTPGRVLVGIGAVAVAAVTILIYSAPTRMARIFGFLDPTADPTGVNHQPQQAIYGLATGGWWGVGLGASRMKWGSLAEAHTDYVLAIVGEELGLWGTLLVLGLFLVIGYAGFRIALRSGTMFARILAAGITSWLMIQALLNIFVVLRWAPVFGVPLPLVSYGGSALLSSMMGLGILVSCAREEPEAKAWLARQRTNKAPRTRISAVMSGRRT